MFNKKDRYLVELSIEFNLSAISTWLRNSGELEDIDNIDKDWGTDAEKISYFIDVLPIGQNSDMYFHRKKGIFSSNIGGIDYLENVDEYLQGFIEHAKIQRLSWGLWRQYIFLKVNQKPVLLAPLDELVVLQTNGKLKEGGYFEKEQKIKVPISFESATGNQAKDFMEVWRGSNSPQSIGYSNGLASISASTLDFEVEY